MSSKCLFGFMLLVLLVSSLCIPAFAQSKKEYMEQLNQARVDYISQRDKLHDEDRILRINWHNERQELYNQLKANPGDRALQEKINEGAKKFFADKSSVYQRLEQQKKDWLNARKELGERIKNAS